MSGARRGTSLGAISQGRRSTCSSRASARESPLWGSRQRHRQRLTDVVPALINTAQTDLFCENLRRYLAGEELLNVLDQRLLY